MLSCPPPFGSAEHAPASTWHARPWCRLDTGLCPSIMPLGYRWPPGADPSTAACTRTHVHQVAPRTPPPAPGSLGTESREAARREGRGCSTRCRPSADARARLWTGCLHRRRQRCTWPAAPPARRGTGRAAPWCVCMYVCMFLSSTSTIHAHMFIFTQSCTDTYTHGSSKARSKTSSTATATAR